MRSETRGEKDERGPEELARTLENVFDGGLERRMTTTANRAKPALELFELTFNRCIERCTRYRSHGRSLGARGWSQRGIVSESRDPRSQDSGRVANERRDRGINAAEHRARGAGPFRESDAPAGFV